MIDSPTLEQPHVAIIIPTYQGGAYLPDTLAGIRAQDFPTPIEIVAVDSESTDHTREILATFGARIVQIAQQQFTHGYSRNLGVQHSSADVIVFMSQDALPLDAHWLQTLVAPLTDPTLGATYARQIARPNATPLEVYFHLALYPPESKRYAVKRDPARSAALQDIFFSNVCSAARREICLAYPFNEQLIMSEDQAFARALLMAGYSTYYNAAAVVSHSHHYDVKTLFRRNFDSAYSLIGVSSDSFLLTARQGIGYVGREAAYLVQHRYWRWLLAIPPYEIIRIAGRLLGAHADHLPKRLRRALSLQPGHWSRPAVQPEP